MFGICPPRFGFRVTDDLLHQNMCLVFSWDDWNESSHGNLPHFSSGLESRMASTERNMWGSSEARNLQNFACVLKGGGSGFCFMHSQAGSITAQGHHSAAFWGEGGSWAGHQGTNTAATGGGFRFFQQSLSLTIPAISIQDGSVSSWRAVGN